MIFIEPVKIDKQWLKRMLPRILTAASVILNGLTAVATAKQTVKCVREIDEVKQDHEPTNKEIFGIVAPKAVVPATLFAAAQATTIYSNIISEKTAAALALAFHAADKKLQAYRAQVESDYGPEVDNRMMAEAITEGTVDIRPSEGKVLFFDDMRFMDGISDDDRPAYDGYFEATWDDFKDARYNINVLFGENGSAYLNDFYSFMNVGRTATGDFKYWDAAEGISSIKIEAEPRTIHGSLDDDTPLIVYDIKYVTPLMDWYDDPAHWGLP